MKVELLYLIIETMDGRLLPSIQHNLINEDSMKYTIHAYKNAENSNPTEAINCSANWEIGHFTTSAPITIEDVKGDTSNPDMTVYVALVESIYNMAEMFGYGDDVGMFITDDENGDFVAFAMHDKGTWVEPCKYCEGWCTIDHGPCL